MSKIEKDDWELLETPGNRTRGGLFISISPAGRISFSKDLVAKLDKKLPRCLIKYSISKQKLRFDLILEIAPNSHKWLQPEKKEGFFCAVSTLRQKNLVPEKLTMYPAELIQNIQAIEVDLDHPIQVVEPRKKKSEKKSEPEAESTMACAECGKQAVVVRQGRLLVLRPHKNPAGRECLCRRPKEGMTAKESDSP